MEQNQEIKNEKNSIDKLKINKDNDKEQPAEDGLFFYVMILQTDNGEKHEIKIYENSNASELAFNFCKIYNLDFATMKYLKKCIKQIIQQFQNNKNRGIVYFLKDNNSIQEVAEEEIITDNSLKKSGTIKKNNNNSNNNNNNTQIEEEKNLKNNKEKININNLDNLDTKEEGNNKNNLEMYKENNSCGENKNEINELDFLINKNSLEDEGQIEQKEYSIDYCLDDDSIEIFAPTEHTTKIEQQSSLRNNSSSLNKKKYGKNTFDKKKFPKNKNMQNNKNINCNKTYNKLLNYPSYSQFKKEQNVITRKSTVNDFKFNNKKDNIIKKNSKYNNITKKPQSVERTLKRKSNRTPHLELSHNNRKSEESKYNKYSYINKYVTNMNEMKMKFFSNYNNYFMKSKNISNILSRNSVTNYHQTSKSKNKENSISKSKSKNKINKNLTQKILLQKNKIKKSKGRNVAYLNSLNVQNLNSSKIDLNTVKNNNFSKDKKRSVLKNKTKTNFNITYSNNTLFNKSKITNKRSCSSKRKKENQSKELFIEKKVKKINTNGIKKILTNSLLNVDKFKDYQDYNKKNSLTTDRMIKNIQIKNKNNKNRDIFNKLFSIETNTEIKNNIRDNQNYCARNQNNKTKNKNNSSTKNKRNNTDINFIQNKDIIKNEYKRKNIEFP